MSCTSAKASTCGRWLTAASTPSCSSGFIFVIRAPHDSHARATLLTAAAGFSGSGVRTTLLRSEEHTSELQSRPHLVCRLLLEKKTQRSSLRYYHTHHQLSHTNI